MTTQSGSCQACGVDQISACGSKDIDEWRASTDAWFGEKLNPALLCAENLYYENTDAITGQRTGAGSGPCSGACGPELANLSQRVDRGTLMTALPSLSATCLQCLDTYNSATNTEDEDAKCPGFIKTYNCALCRQKSVANVRANSPGSAGGYGPVDPNAIDTMNVNCCACGPANKSNAGGDDSKSSGKLSKTEIGLIVGIAVLFLVVLVIGLFAFRRSGPVIAAGQEIELAQPHS